MGYQNPGELFIARYGPPESGEDVLAYVQFLRDESGLSTEPPIDLGRIYTRFGVPYPKRAILPNLQGLLINPEYGIILVNQTDPPVRQRFTECHELVELLFAALPSSGGWAARERVGPFKLPLKEQLCNEGAAELLMPRCSFAPRVRQASVSYVTTRQLAHEYQVSITAALVQMVRVGPGAHAVVLWRMKHKPSELRTNVHTSQLALFGDAPQTVPSKKLRVEWSLTGRDTPYIPPNKSVPDDSSVCRAWQDGVLTVASDFLELGQFRGRFGCESQPFEVENERQVISLLHLPGDTCTTNMDAQPNAVLLLTSPPSEKATPGSHRPEL